MSAIPAKQKVVLIRETGGPEVLRYEEDYPVPKVHPSHILIKNRYAGVNFIETYFRTGLYPCEKPYVLGREAVGVVVAVGSSAGRFKVGDQVAYLSSGTFAQYTALPENGNISKLPDDIQESELQAVAGSLVNGLTALTLVEEAYKPQAGEFVLVYAAAGGVGQLLIQVLHARSVRVIAVASTDEKLRIAKSRGAEFLINSSSEDIVAKVLEFTDSEGVSASYDSVGKDTFETTLQAVKRKGTIVSFGNASGAVPPFSIQRLTPKNLKILRPQLYGYLATREEWEHYSSELLRLISNKELIINITNVSPLREFRQLTELLESRQTTGKLLLAIPD
ncbi:AaceriABL090Wp [[Ashbya] aceris (nom. inval.)]|nr:AaceriABL090Wp [[Ashbya] aceris (nom. inval.)]